MHNDFEINYVLDTNKGQVLMDAPESLTGEPGIDWDDEDATDNLLPIPQITSNEAYDSMDRFAEKQEPAVAEKLIDVLNRRKPFRNFKEKVIQLGIEDEWYTFEQSDAKEAIFDWMNDLNIPYEKINQK
ncbi:Uncharacterised protein family (UPF0158) [Virgibacillus subterraneus]|uniref:Uncharacterized protein n=1 Tax=Virgibacillus subterraneus TaxID=621109 RepID=A0A1H9JBC5_9BACI|nr:UPF0158 family protein [Virgibacillus subterraneus]SEQ83875.1 Uncharacterised protein family (UPF0158) [Virgibacillus subterraneus]